MLLRRTQKEDKALPAMAREAMERSGGRMQDALAGNGNPAARTWSISGWKLPVNRHSSGGGDARIHLFRRPMYFRVAVRLCVTWDTTHD
jgi:hypothetical protein